MKIQMRLALLLRAKAILYQKSDILTVTYFKVCFFKSDTVKRSKKETKIRNFGALYHSPLSAIFWVFALNQNDLLD